MLTKYIIFQITISHNRFSVSFTIIGLSLSLKKVTKKKNLKQFKLRKGIILRLIFFMSLNDK